MFVEETPLKLFCVSIRPVFPNVWRMLIRKVSRICTIPYRQPDFISLWTCCPNVNTSVFKFWIFKIKEKIKFPCWYPLIAIHACFSICLFVCLSLSIYIYIYRQREGGNEIILLNIIINIGWEHLKWYPSNVYYLYQ